ncbi:MAG: AMP-binding protein, partial [Clostridia bacterium]|nr:AMP-binding protein [Clostridia bacterium]
MAKIWNPEAECMSREEMHKLQSERLCSKIKEIYENVPYYRAKMDEKGVKPEDIRSVDDLSLLPFTSKQDLREAYPYGLFARPLKDIVEIHATSGTTGKQVIAGYTKNDIALWGEVMARVLTAAGGDETSVVQSSYGYGLFTGGLGAHYGAQTMGAMAIPTSSGNTERQIRLMKDLGTTILCCTPSYATFIGETIRDMGLDISEFKLKAGVFGAEPWTVEMKRELEKLLNIKTIDVYGLTEIIGPGVGF